MANLRTRRTHAEIVTFINAWLDSSSTAETARNLRRQNKRHGTWPYSTSTASVYQFAAKLRRGGVELPHRARAEVRVDDLNAMIQARMS
jgi:hypothetical protein